MESINGRTFDERERVGGCSSSEMVLGGSCGRRPRRRRALKAGQLVGQIGSELTESCQIGQVQVGRIDPRRLEK